MKTIKMMGIMSVADMNECELEQEVATVKLGKTPKLQLNLIFLM